MRIRLKSRQNKGWEFRNSRLLAELSSENRACLLKDGQLQKALGAALDITPANNKLHKQIKRDCSRRFLQIWHTWAWRNQGSGAPRFD